MKSAGQSREDLKQKTVTWTAFCVRALRLPYFIERRDAAALCSKLSHIMDIASSSLGWQKRMNHLHIQ